MKKLLFILSALLVAGCSTVANLVEFENENEVTFYNSFGYLDGEEWVIPMRMYVHHRRESMESWTTSFAAWRYNLDEDEREIFQSRIDNIVADSEWRESVEFRFKDDPTNKTYRIKNEEGDHPKTDLNGLKEGYIRISQGRADSLLQAQNSDNNWLSIEAISTYHSGTGRVQLIEPEGVSVISDIDDTVKITEIPAGSRIVIRNTFFKEYTAAPGMAEMYNSWDVDVFHYVSGAPWQLYKPLSQFLFDEEQGFPKGSFHMKNVRKNFFNLSSWRDLGQLITNENFTFDQKIEQISTLFETFPNREFILVGDSGERDPDVYDKIREIYPDQVKEIIIRDVVNDREENPERLEGMTIIPAKTVTFGESQFQ